MSYEALQNILKSRLCYMSGVERKSTDNQAAKNKNIFIKLASIFYTNPAMYLSLYQKALTGIFH